MSKQNSQLCGMHIAKLNTIEKQLDKIEKMLEPLIEKTAKHNTAIAWITLALGLAFSGLGICFGFLAK
jgi:hypothetical protein